MRGWSALGLSLLLSQQADATPYLIVGIDQKQVWDDEGRAVYMEGGKDLVSVIDIARPQAPKLVASLPVPNSIVGPPTNLAITPDNRLAIVADSVVHARGQDGTVTQSPSNRINVIALDGGRSKVVQSLEVGLQPSGLSINAAGNLALVTYRGETVVGVFRISGKRLTEVGRVDVHGKPAHVAIAADGKTALVVKQDDDAVSILEIKGETANYLGDLPTADGPYNVAITPDSQLGITSDRGFLTVIDLAGARPQVRSTVKVGAGSEGLAISPRGDLVVSVALLGSNGSKTASDFHEHGALVVLANKEGKLTQVQQIEAGRVPEGIAFSPDRRWLYVANFYDSNIQIYRVSGQRLVDTGERLKLPGRPASLRGSVP